MARLPSIPIDTSNGIGDVTLTVDGLSGTGLSLVDNGDGSGQITGTVAEGSVVGSPYEVTITANDSADQSDTEVFTITVEIVSATQFITTTADTGSGAQLYELDIDPISSTAINSGDAGSLGTSFGVADKGDGTVAVILATSVVFLTIDTWAQTGSASFAGASATRGAAWDADGNLWVGDVSLSQLRKYDTSGTLLDSFSTGGTSYGAAVDPNDGTLWTSYTGGGLARRIRHYSTAGSILATYDLSAFATQTAGIDVDADGTLWVADNSANELHHVDTDGSLIETFTLDATDRLGLTIRRSG